MKLENIEDDSQPEVKGQSNEEIQKDWDKRVDMVLKNINELERLKKFNQSLGNQFFT